MKLTLAVLLMVAIAQIPSCNLGSGGDDTIVGYVEDKYRAPAFEGGPAQTYIMIDGVEHRVPMDFWIKVSIGDLVKYEKGVWKIVRKVGT